MLKLEDIKSQALISGIEPGEIVRIVATEPVGTDALTVYYKKSEGQVLERMLFRTDEASLSLAEAGRPWAFDASGEDFKLAVEAWRIDLAHLFDPMMAVHTSNVEPLPHQITAVYESMLPRQPLRYMLADDPGAGKTIMAGLFIRELLMRADAKRVLIVAPGSLVEQWQDEMFEKFGLSFTLFSREQVENSRSGNPFEDQNLMVARVDQLSRNEDLLEKLEQSQWDLIVVDEAHKLSASYFGTEVKKTKRFQLGELLGSITRHFLLMTATPHNGKEADFQLFMSPNDMWSAAIAEDEATGLVTYVAGTHYEVNPRLGMIKAISGVAGGIADGAKLDVSYKYAAVSGTTMSAMTKSNVRIRVKMDGQNWADGRSFVTEIFQMRLQPTSEFSLVGEDFAEVTFEGVPETPSGGTTPMKHIWLS